MKEVSVLFVCTGNIFRSMSAEYILKDLLAKKKVRNIRVQSAGTVAKKQAMKPEVRCTLKSFGINPQHTQRKLTRSILAKNTIVLAMATRHQKSIQKTFHIHVPLFHEFAIHRKTSILDSDEISDAKNQKAKARYRVKTVKHIQREMPHVLAHILKISARN